MGTSQSKSREKFIKDAKEIHGDKYDYSMVEYNSDMSHIIIICKDHGPFKQSPFSHKYGLGCPRCATHNCITYKLVVCGFKFELIFEKGLENWMIPILLGFLLYFIYFIYYLFQFVNSFFQLCYPLFHF